MSQFVQDQNRDTILIVHEKQQAVVNNINDATKKLSQILGRNIKVLNVIDKTDKKPTIAKMPKNFKTINVNTSSVRQLERALLPYLDSLLLIVCRGEKSIPYFRNIIPHVPYLHAPTVQSLDWATNKIMMRRRLRTFNKKTSPKYTIVENASEASVAKIKKNIGFPCIVKPAGLAASMLVSVCYYDEELEKVLKKSFSRLNKVYKQSKGRGTPAILVEQFMEGRMYSVDIYVNNRGTMYATPLTNVVTAFAKGKDDFYGYKRQLPVTLSLQQQQIATQVAKDGVAALGLRSVTAHVELMQTDDGWKVIELAPRMGGYRHDMYNMAYGIDHTLNDMLIRLPMRPDIPRKKKGFSAALQYYAEREGHVKSVTGIKTIKNLESYVKHNRKIAKGEYAHFARHGGTSVLDVILFNRSRSSLLADIRRIEKSMKIETTRHKKEVVPEIVSEVTPELLADQ